MEEQKIPDEGEIYQALQLLIPIDPKTKWETTNKKYDEHCLTFWEIRINTQRGFDEYTYKIDGRFVDVHDKSKGKIPTIDVANFTGDEYPSEGSNLASYVDGRWNFHKS